MPDFLQVSDVLMLQSGQIDLYGGEHGVRGLGLLDSAIAQPQASFGGQFLHVDLFEMAAAYLLHIVQNHPFLDGNKRAGAVAALVFLEMNGAEVDAARGSIHDLTMSVATGQMYKAGIAEFFRTRAH